MSSTLEGSPQGAALGPALTDGLRVLTAGAVIPFTQYVRYVLPLDGYVFWLKTQQIALEGSLHISTNKRQNEDETISINRVVFTTAAMVDALNQIEPNTIWVGESQGVKFSFSESGPRFRQSGVFHYVGDAVYPALLSQLVDVGSQLPADTLVVSNSLPAWLSLKSYKPVWLAAPNPNITLYPSFLVPSGLAPPYGSVHIDPNQTTAIQSTAAIGPLRNHYQLARDRVRVTLYGATNDQALAFLDLVNQFSLDTDTIGMMNMPIVRDEKRTQAELGVIAMKKVLDFEVNYNQTSVRNAAQQLITSVTNNYIIFPP